MLVATHRLKKWTRIQHKMSHKYGQFCGCLAGVVWGNQVGTGILLKFYFGGCYTCQKWHVCTREEWGAPDCLTWFKLILCKIK